MISVVLYTATLSRPHFGLGLANHEAEGHPCGAIEECQEQDTCDGAGHCQDSGFEPAGTLCGDDADTACTHPDFCDGSGTCEDNHEEELSVCDDDDPCTMEDHCQSGQCLGVPTDLDRDGQGPTECGGDDCNDDSSEVHGDLSEGPPGDETCSDGLDNDCDEATDDDDAMCNETIECPMDCSSDEDCALCGTAIFCHPREGCCMECFPDCFCVDWP